MQIRHPFPTEREIGHAFERRLVADRNANGRRDGAGPAAEGVTKGTCRGCLLEFAAALPAGNLGRRGR